VCSAPIHFDPTLSKDDSNSLRIQALEDHELAGKVLVSGQDAELAAIIRILDGTQTMTVTKPLGSGATLAAEAAVAWANGDTAKTTATISMGKETIPAILSGPVTLTQDNVKQTLYQGRFSESRNDSEEFAERKVASVKPPARGPSRRLL
jgi:D-xylose transport system substrate-binding protein